MEKLTTGSGLGAQRRRTEEEIKRSRGVEGLLRMKTRFRGMEQEMGRRGNLVEGGGVCVSGFQD